jgi:TRAP-type C4-dicarboxylate transport system substrate-binding protein
MKMNRREFGASMLATAGVVAAPAVLAQQKIEMKLAYFVGDQHAMSQWLIRWSDNLEKQSGGRISVKRFPGSQMGPVQQHYDFARTGQADVAWFLHGATPGRFPLTEIVQVPYLVGSAEIGTKVLNDPESRTRRGCASVSPRRLSATSSPRSAPRRSACSRPSRSSSCRRAP